MLFRSPNGVRPVAADATQVAANTWRIETGPIKALDVMLVAADRDPPGLAIWTDLSIQGKQARVSARVVPATPWTDDVLKLEKDVALDVARVYLVEDTAAGAADPSAQELVWSESADRGLLVVTLPAAAAGTRLIVGVEAAAPFAGDETSLASLPLVRAPRSRWAAGGLVLRLAPDLSLARIDFDECLPVTPEAASRWPLAERRAADSAAFAGARQAEVHVEQQGPRAAVRAAVALRQPEWDVARVTTIDVAPAIVLGRAFCDIRVLRGEA